MTRLSLTRLSFLSPLSWLLRPVDWPAMAYECLRRHRALVFCALLALLGLSLVLATKIPLDKSSQALFPDSPEARRMAQAMESTPLAKVLLVELSTAENGRAEDLAAAAHRVLAAIPGDLAGPMLTASPPGPEALLQLVPFLFDKEAAADFEQAASPEAVRQRVARLRQSLSLMWGKAPADWLLADPLDLRRLVLRALPPPELAALSDPLLGFPLSADGRHLLLSLRPLAPLHDVDAAQALETVLETALNKERGQGIESLVVGGQRHTAANARAIESDIRFVAICSMLGLFAVYLTLVRSPAMFWLLLTPCAAAALALGSMGLFASALSGLALGFGSSVLGIAEDYAVHIHFALRGGQGPGRTLRAVVPGVFQGYLINSVGFGALLFSSIPAVRHVALFALLTLAAGFLLAVFILPLCPYAEKPLSPPQMQASLRMVPVRRRVWACAALLIFLCGLGVARLDLDVSPSTLGADMAAIKQESARVMARWTSGERALLVVHGATEAQVMNAARRISRILQEQGQKQGQARDGAGAVHSLVSIWPEPAEAESNRERWNALVARHGEPLLRALRTSAAEQGFAAEAFAPFERIFVPSHQTMSLALLEQAGLGEVLRTFLPEKGSHETRLLMLLEGEVDMQTLPQDLQDCSSLLSPGAVERVMAEQLRQEVWLVPLALALCLALLLLFFRQADKAVMACVPSLCAVLSVLAGMAISGTPLTIASLAAMPLVLGLAADHGIIAVHEMEHDFAAGGARAMLVVSLTTLAGMGVLAFASHPVLRGMGQVIFWGLLAEAPAAVWLLPRLCRPKTREEACAG